MCNFTWHCVRTIKRFTMRERKRERAIIESTKDDQSSLTNNGQCEKGIRVKEQNAVILVMGNYVKMSLYKLMRCDVTAYVGYFK